MRTRSEAALGAEKKNQKKSPMSEAALVDARKDKSTQKKPKKKTHTRSACRRLLHASIGYI